MTDEPGFTGRLRWFRAGAEHPEGALGPAVVAVTNLRQVARRHKDLLTAPGPPPIPGPDGALPLAELLDLIDR